MHALRFDISYRDYVKTNMELINCDDMRDSRGIEAGATGMLKILFPDKLPSEEDFYRYCVNPALEMRQRVRDELCKLDREYEPLSMRSQYPDEFQLTHRRVEFVDPSKIDPNLLSKLIEPEQAEEPVEQIMSDIPASASTGEDADEKPSVKSVHTRKRIWL